MAFVTRIKSAIGRMLKGWKRYLIELLVVFLGVTTAFALDSWAKNRDLDKQARQYLQGFHNDLQNDEDQLLLLIEQFSRNEARMKRLINMMQKNEIDSDSLGIYMMHMNSLAKFAPNISTYASMTNSGSLSLIDDFDLRRRLIAYYQRYEQAKLVDEVGMNYVNKYIFPFMFKNVEMYKAEFADPAVVKTLEFRNIVSGYTFLMQQSGIFYTETLDSCRQFRQGISLALDEE